MICDPGPVFCLAEDGTNLAEGQFTEDPKLEDFPVGIFQGVERGMDPEGGILIRDLLVLLLRRVSSTKQFFAMAHSQVTSSDSFRKEEDLEKALKNASWVISSAVCRSPAIVII